MRVISQKGIEPTVDLPYEQATLTVNGKFISAIVCGGTNLLIANYSTPEKAEEAMVKLQWRYMEFFATLLRTSRYTCAPGFRFPEDSEV